MNQYQPGLNVNVVDGTHTGFNMEKLTFIDLFSGVGGVGLGLKKTGKFKCVWSNDINEYANKIYIRQFGEENHYSGDIRQVNARDIPDHDVLCAGFPCQAFSVAGLRKGFEDTRGTLFFEIARIIQTKKPRLLLLENVK
ncbi:DNA (cytosine-5-)-methyltransferase, partial [Patescibacteria group bacterium]|nr:DNA (cytosine-5-)-methyltransferase [Patescibacteria group bacterium]